MLYNEDLSGGAKMKKILIMNAGSSSVKWKLFEDLTEKVIAAGLIERINMANSISTVKYEGKKATESHECLSYPAAAELIFSQLKSFNFVKDLSEISAVGHRIVAGSTLFRQATLMTQEKIAELKQLDDFAPLHNPTEVKYVELVQRQLPGIPQYAVFDSQFFTNLPEVNAIYSLPYQYTQKFGIRRYGEHGISHDYISRRAALLLKKPYENLKLITLHLGSGASIAAEKSGRAFDTSMGFAPLTGLTMGTRAGDTDPSIIPYLMKKLGCSVEEIMQILNQKSGLLGISELSPDMRDLIAAKDQPQAKLAVEIFINRIIKYVGAYYTELGGVDALIFAGGIGENNAFLRQEIIKRLAVLGLKLDEKLNRVGNEGIISNPASVAKVLIVPTDEELSMVQQIKQQEETKKK